MSLGSFFESYEGDIEIDLDDAIDDVDDGRVIEYFENRFPDRAKDLDDNIEELSIAYFHGDFDLEKLIRKIGIENIEKIIARIKE